MIPSDPRRRIQSSLPPTTTSTSNSIQDPPPSSILFSGEEKDAVDIDEAMPQHPPLSLHSARGVGLAAESSSSWVQFPQQQQQQQQQYEQLLSRIITPSPYPHHNSGPTSSRFRNALHRVTTHPTTDVEAWQALMTEVQSCYKNISSVHAVDADTLAKLDWAESCYGTLLKHFPTATTYLLTIMEMMYQQSARVGEEHGPLMDYGLHETTSRRAMKCEAKLEYLLCKALGFDLHGRPVPSSPTDRTMGVEGSSSMEPVDQGEQNGESEDKSPKQGEEDDVTLVGGMCSWSVEIWMLYVQKCARDAARQALTAPVESRPAVIQRGTQRAYELAISQAGFGHNNHVLWKSYLQFVRSNPNWIGDSANSALHQNVALQQQQQMVQLRSVYQRLVCLPMTGLDQLWQEYELWERAQNEALAQALTAEFAPRYQHARTVYLERSRVYNHADLQLDRLATPPAEESDEDYVSKMQEEINLLNLWKTRCSYERTNPERIQQPQELAHRIRSGLKEMACVLARHPEAWHMWSMWELLASENRRMDRAVAVLQMGQGHIPDSTLLAWTESQIIESQAENGAGCIQVMERFLERSPNTLGFVLCQQLVRRYQGADAARAIFARARRVLKDTAKTRQDDGEKGKSKVGDLDEEAVEANQDQEKGADVATEQRWIVTNRLDPSIGVQLPSGLFAKVQNEVLSSEGSTPEGGGRSNAPGPITWHLFASHANMEHRLNRAPEIAARIYELGLRKHSVFLTKPAYVKRYAQLLFEMGDDMNLRALLTRAIAACDEQRRQHALATFWDLTLQFESILSGADRSSLNVLQNIERKRRETLMGPDVEDVATGNPVGAIESVLIGAQKSTISDQLIRLEGYDFCSKIVSGMSRAVDLLGLMGIWGADDHETARGRNKSKEELDEDRQSDFSGGKSDVTFQRRLQFQQLTASGVSADVAALDGTTSAGSRIVSARERLQQGAAVPALPGQMTAIMLAIQQSPEWIRPLLLLLPASRLRLPIVPKPPPHLTEMALATLRQNALPSARPEESGLSAKRIRVDGGGDSSDEENGPRSSGYGASFRARQRSRMGTSMMNGSVE